MRWPLILGLAALLLTVGALAYPLVATATNDVAFCMTCHVMAPYGELHRTSVHRDEATCSECHTGSVLQKYTDGFRHLTANFTRQPGDPIVLRAGSREVVASQCAVCHAATSNHTRAKRDKGENCLECHLGHSDQDLKLLDGAEKADDEHEDDDND